MFKKFKTSYLIITFICLSIIGVKTLAIADEIEKNIVEERYSTVYSNWQKNNVKSTEGFHVNIKPEEFTVSNNEIIVDVKDSKEYKTNTALLKKDNSIKININVEEDGLYEINMDYLPLSQGLIPIQCQIKINDEFQYFESRRIVFPVLWENSTHDFDTDRKGNEIMPLQNQVSIWNNYEVKDPNSKEPENFKFYLKKGINIIEIIGDSGEVLIGDINVISPQRLISYNDYKVKYKHEKKENILIIQEAEKNKYKDNTAIGAYASRDLEVFPYDTNKLLLNTLVNENSGETVYYEIEVEETGLYNLAFKYLQDFKINSKVYRTITIDNKIPFAEAKSFAFESTKKWTTQAFGDKNGDFDIYLEKGKHLIGLTADASIYNNMITKLNSVMTEINNLSLEIKKMVGNNNDKFRDWVITDYLPNIEKDLNSMADNIQKELDEAIKINDGNVEVEEFNKLKISIKKLRELALDPNQLPSRLSQLSEGSGSVSQMLGDSISLIEIQPILLDQIYFYTDKKELPTYKTSFAKKFTEGTKRFFYSFVQDSKDEDKNQVVLNVWVNRARNYIDLMQKMVDEDFTKKTGIKVNFSVMPNEQKLILSNSAGTQPDVALGISTTIPYDFAIRDSALDLSKMPGYGEVIKNVSPGALTSYRVDDGIYGLPETQDFYVTFYRKDILEKLNIPIPETWEEVIDILPELQRYGMNYYTPLASGNGMKPFMFTAPFIYQNGGKIYNEETLQVSLNSEQALEGIKLMTDLFTIYGLPLQVPNFYNHFRYGTLPIGIGNMENYLKLKNAAPELDGSWELAPHPGIKNEGGEIINLATGSAQGAMIFKDTKYQDASWEFLKWWLSKEVQVNFAHQLKNVYGPEYIWNTANLEAFKELPMDEEDKKIILEQWESLFEVPKVPAGYMVERELSNVWNKIVFDDENPRAAIDNAITIMNRELKRKFEEFGYMKDGEIIKKYKIPSIEEEGSLGEEKK